MLFRIRAAQVALRRNEKGATALEYGLIAGMVAVVIVGTLTLIGGDLLLAFQTAQAGLAGVP